MNSFRYLLEQAILSKLKIVALLSSLEAKALTDAQRAIILSVTGDTLAHARVYSALLSARDIPVLNPVPSPDAQGDLACLIDQAVFLLSLSRKESALIARFSPTEGIRRIALCVLSEELNHTRILNAIQLSDTLP